MIPIIGMTSTIENDTTVKMFGTYAAAIEHVGGLPLLLPYVEDEHALDTFVKLCDGFLFTGGADIEPLHYGEQTKSVCGIVQPLRDKLELEIFKRVYAADKPILAICRGAQLINVALEGTLYQDIPTEYETTLSHVQSEERFSPSHPVFIEQKTPLASLVQKDRMTANSFHHQAIKTLGKGLTVMARAADGLIEAVYSTDRKYLRAYQWHPERLCNNVDNKHLFEDFVSACSAKESQL